MKVAFVSQYCDSILPPFQNSVGACTYGLARLLARSCDVTVYGVRAGRAREVGRDFSEQGVQYCFFPASRLDRTLFKLFRKYARLAAPFNQGMTPPASTSRWIYPFYGQAVAKALSLQPYDIIHVQHTTQYLAAIRAANPAAKIILNIHHELYPQCNRTVLEKRLRHVDFITCVSQFVANQIQHTFPDLASRCQVIYNGIEADEFAREKPYGAIRQRQVKRILYAGRVSPEKGIHVLLDALQIVVQRYPNVQLEVVGPPSNLSLAEAISQDDQALVESLKPFCLTPYVEHLRRHLAPVLVDKVSFLGKIDRPELIDRFFDADLLVLPSLWNEGFGIPPVEAMAAGTPVVATRSGAVVETVQDGQTGLLVAQNDAMALATAILRLLENDALRESMGRAGRRRALHHFTWERSATQFLQRYQRLCHAADLVEPNAVPISTGGKSAPLTD